MFEARGTKYGPASAQMPIRTYQNAALPHNFPQSNPTGPSSSTTTAATDPFQSLPNELLLRIFSHLDADQLLICGRVCRRWRAVSGDWHLWQAKLLEAMGSQWCTIVCHSRPRRVLSLRDPSAVHPREIYQFLLQFIPKCQLNSSPQQAANADALTVTNTEQRSGSLPSEPDDGEDGGARTTGSGGTGPRLMPFSAILSAWWGQLRNAFPFPNRSAAASEASARPRFVLFGPGFDHRDTNHLFRKMVDARTKSFEPIDMFIGHMGFGSGITLRLSAQAQEAVMDSSICSSHDSLLPPRTTGNHQQHPQKQGKRTPASSPPSPSPSPPQGRHSCLSRPKSVYRASSTLPSHRSPAPPPTSPCAFDFQPFGVHNAEFPCHCHKLYDFTFDLSFLYSLPAHLNHVFNDQYSRLCVSRLFVHSSSAGHGELPPELDFLSSLTVTEEMRELCRTIDGLIYAIDARESADQLSHLYFELSSVLRGFPPKVANRIPIIILYIMPKEAIKLSVQRSEQPVLVQPELVNRDSYSGAEYTAAWHDSLLLPISALRLFEFSNPWRLQKCSSNDIKTLIQGIMWLHVKHQCS
uniref:F-box domain-containing protein n=1 Tax=Schistocephalus solidus TaxID=70667 RepID=A0A0X3NH34_SCHSO